MKATEAADYEDPSFRVNWKGAHAAGLIRTAYHFAHPSISASAQAAYFVATVRAAGGWNASSTLPLMLDLEDADKLGPAAVWAWVQAFCADVKALTGKDVLMYTGYYFWRDSVGNPSDSLGTPLWVAAYIPKPLIPSAWRNYTFWQYTDKASVPGIAGGVDGDYFNGDKAALEAMCFP